jgi:hypothetical protein
MLGSSNLCSSRQSSVQFSLQHSQQQVRQCTAHDTTHEWYVHSGASMITQNADGHHGRPPAAASVGAGHCLLTFSALSTDVWAVDTADAICQVGVTARASIACSLRGHHIWEDRKLQCPNTNGSRKQRQEAHQRDLQHVSVTHMLPR